ncbi:GAF and ANTAR domain-containing protein [Rhodococcus sp. NPDC057297]|uniref:GAF and ANTAR domain-containing protein n=1 Tax=Rhodococcus sp. NPDC057297 TaxID=3346090 RepID=UPI00362E27D0
MEKGRGAWVCTPHVPRPTFDGWSFFDARPRTRRPCSPRPGRARACARGRRPQLLPSPERGGDVHRCDRVGHRAYRCRDCADILVVAGAKAFQSHAATSELPLRLDSLQERLGEGPCVDAARTEVLVASDDLATDPRWPRFGPAAVEAGERSALSFQLYTNEDTVGALNVFALTPNAFGPRDIEIGEILATHGAVAVYAANKNKQFESALASRDLIGQAKGMLMERYRIDAAQAFALMSKLSQDSNVPLAALAADIVRLGCESSGSR